MKPRTKIAVLALGSTLAIAAVLGWYSMQRWQFRSEALVSRGGQKQLYPDGRGVEIVIADNDFGETAVVLVLHCSTIDPERRVLPEGRVFSSDDPIGEFKSSYRVVTHYPADPSISGVWVGGIKRDTGHGLVVVYISDQQSATDIVIPTQEQSAFVNDARELDPLEFIEKWVPLQVRDRERLPLTGVARDPK